MGRVKWEVGSGRGEVIEQAFLCCFQAEHRGPRFFGISAATWDCIKVGGLKMHLPGWCRTGCHVSTGCFLGARASRPRFS